MVFLAHAGAYMPFKIEIVFLGAGQTNIHFHTRWVNHVTLCSFPPNISVFVQVISSAKLCNLVS